MNVLVLDEPSSNYPRLFEGDNVTADTAFSVVFYPNKLVREAQLVVFTGGDDIGVDKTRDHAEAAVFRRAVAAGIKTLGICRGAQLLHVLNGGELEQHVEGHQQGHSIRTNTGRRVPVTSTHHQMMKEDTIIDGELLAWASIVGQRDPEVVYYRKTGSLCVQFHPEMAEQGSPCRRYFNSLLKKFMLGEL